MHNRAKASNRLFATFQSPSITLALPQIMATWFGEVSSCLEPNVQHSAVPTLGSVQSGSLTTHRLKQKLLYDPCPARPARAMVLPCYEKEFQLHESVSICLQVLSVITAEPRRCQQCHGKMYHQRFSLHCSKEALYSPWQPALLLGLYFLNWNHFTFEIWLQWLI